MAVGSRSDFFDTHCSPAPTGICLHCSSLAEQSVYKWMVYYITSNPSEYKHARIFFPPVCNFQFGGISAF